MILISALKANRRCNWDFSYNTLMRFMRQHKNGDAYTQLYIENRLENANYHRALELISEKKYDEFKEYIKIYKQ
jgi:hypothetical protein